MKAIQAPEEVVTLYPHDDLHGVADRCRRELCSAGFLAAEAFRPARPR